ncbi:MAG: tetratricopeptide repeat protein [Betaproteobacteria bacterium]|nr:tetratricopeptide repeat protein [Betaproteobacteria bacterium]
MHSQWRAFGIGCFFLLSFVGAAYAQDGLSKVLELRDSPTPSSTTQYPVKPWRQDEKEAVLKLSELIQQRARGLMERATAYRLILLYRTEKIESAHAAAEANPYEHSIYFADAAFRVWPGPALVHEVAHLADSDWKISASKAWVNMVGPLMKRVREIVKEKGMTLREAGKARLYDIALKEGLPTLQASLNAEEAFADYMAAMVFPLPQWLPPGHIAAFLETKALSTPFKPDESTKYYHLGLSLFTFKEGNLIISEGGKLDEAIDAFTRAIKLDPEFGNAYYYRAAAWRLKKDWDKAISDLSEVIRIFPNERRLADPAYFERGLAWMRKEEPDKAIADFSQAIKIDPSFREYYYNRALVWRDKKEFDKAIADFSEVIKLEPDNASAYYERGEAWVAKKELDQAIADFSESIRLARHPMGFPYYYRRGQLFQDKKEFDKAIADFSEVIKVAPIYTAAYYYRGLAWRDKKEFDKAVADFSAALKLAPNHAEAYLRRGFILWRVNKEPEKGIADFSEVIKFKPGEPLAFYYRGWIWKDKKEFDKAVTDLTEAVKLFPEKGPLYGHAHFLRAIVYLIQGKWTEALAGLEKAVWGKDLHAYYFALIPGLMRERVGDLEGARRIWKERRERPREAWPWPLVDVFLGEKSEAEVFALIEKAREKERSGQRCEAYFYLGFHALSRGNKQLARDYYQKSLNEANADPTVKTYFEFEMAEAELRRMK